MQAASSEYTEKTEPRRTERHPRDPRVILCNDPAGLLQIYKPGIKAVICRTPISAQFNLQAAGPGFAEKLIDKVASVSFHDNNKNQSYLLDLAEGDSILHDALKSIGKRIALLKQTFESVAKCKADYFALYEKQGRGNRIATMQYHTDLAPLVMTSSVIGPGTDWVTGKLNHNQLAALNHRRELPEGSSIEKTGTGDILLFKGHDHPDKALSIGLVHNSPRTGGAPRLAFALFPKMG